MDRGFLNFLVAGVLLESGGFFWGNREGRIDGERALGFVRELLCFKIGPTRSRDRKSGGVAALTGDLIFYDL